MGVILGELSPRQLAGEFGVPTDTEGAVIKQVIKEARPRPRV